MTILQVIALLVSLTALFAYVNHRLLRLPTTIGVMLIALLMSLAQGQHGGFHRRAYERFWIC